MSFYLETARCLEGNFVPTSGDSPDQRNKLTLHSAIRTILGTNPDWSTLAYRNHAELSQFIQLTYQGLSETLGERSDTWCMRSLRTEEEIISLLKRAEGEIQLPVPPVPQVRPGMKKISGPSKSRGVIAAEIANIAHALGRGFADVFGDFLQPGISDLELINSIDRRLMDIQNEPDIDWALPKKFSTVLPLWWRTSDSTVVSDFCYSMFNEWSGIQDQDLDAKLDALVGESKRSIEPLKNEGQEKDQKTFVAFDFETTGLSASKDRVIEIGCVKFDSRFKELERFETLINPKRDVGRTDIHGITPSHLREAPEFGDIVQEFCEFINGSTLIAHNKSFDLRFLQSELARYGLAIAELDGLCTMELIQSAYPNSPRRLGQCCEFLGIAVENTHQALSDAYMSAQIAIHVLKNFGYPAIPNAIDFVKSEFPAQRKSVLVRSDTETDSEKTSGFIERLITQLPSSTSLGGRFTIASAEYLNLLDQVLEDRLIETQEAEELKDLALSFGLSLENVQILHSSYLFNLCNLAVADGEVTANEEADIALVSSLLGIAEWREFLNTKISSSVALQTNPSMIPDGATVCFTGTMSQSREVLEDFARENGLQVLLGVTKKLDFLVVADPYTESSKARQARKYGTSIMSEKAFRELLKIENRNR